ncbi:DUF4418 family protein [Bifidobacterium amazonense]|uniref:DUF4418 family protein n=1 Tax=Bifidobacterium amazonense TaxID=2809027 RepID=A0ABS9VTV8_9BIFI|nr:DUF4418 family protein [Bifidobacterium amazonense]MCH9275240.1 DUF4418 family protein [Bifidobacterium amazonense]
MTRKLFATLPAIVLGALIAVAPQTFAYVCKVEDGMKMACHYTAQAALGLGVVIALLGVIGLFVDSKVRAGLDIAVALNAAFVVAVPTVLIGVCKGAMMHCHMVTLPTLIVLGVLAVVLAAIAAWLDLNAPKNAKR